MRCAMIEWVDSMHQANWNHKDSLEAIQHEFTCGLLVKDEADFVTVALSHAVSTEEWGQVVSIPKCAIKNIVVFNKTFQQKKAATKA